MTTRQPTPCPSCGGAGYIEVGAGLDALQERYPDLPIREMARRGWFGDIGDGEDVAWCDAAFLRFWNAPTHNELRDRIKNGTAWRGGTAP